MKSGILNPKPEGNPKTESNAEMQRTQGIAESRAGKFFSFLRVLGVFAFRFMALAGLALNFINSGW